MDLVMRTGPLRGAAAVQWERFLHMRGLQPDPDMERVALLYEGDALVACGALNGRVLQLIAVDETHEGAGTCARIVSALVSEAYHLNRTHLFLYTKPAHGRMFASLGFYPLVQTQDMLMCENRRGGLDAFLASIEKREGVCGAVVLNANPFTLGHQYLVETAAQACSWLYAFVVSEENACFSFAERFALVQAGTAHIKNCLVYGSEDYLVSRATFPTYFLKDRAQVDSARAELDLTLFGERIASALHITRRFVGTEPYCALTRAYNLQMRRMLPRWGVEVVEIERKDGVSASRVRALMEQGDLVSIRPLVPDATFALLASHKEAARGE